MLDTNANVAIGAIGSFHILLAYVLVSFSKELGPFGVSADSFTYQLINFVGGAFAGASAFLTENPGSYPLGALETIWAAIALVAMVKMAITRRWPTSSAAAAAEGMGGGAAGLDKHRQAKDAEP